MKKVEGFKMRKLGTEHIVLAEGANLVNFNKMISFNESAAYLWENLEGEFTVEDLANLLTQKYDVDSQTALKDSDSIAQSWLKAGLITE